MLSNENFGLIWLVIVSSVATFSFLYSNDIFHTSAKLSGNQECKRGLYVHFPKTGGTSVSMVMQHQLPDLTLPPPKEFWNSYHMPAESQRNFYGSAVFNNAFSFATVRNPYAVFVSMFFMLDVCPSDFLLPPGEFGNFCDLFWMRWPNSTDAAQDHRKIRQLFTEWLLLMDAEANMTDSRFFSGYFPTERLPPNKVVSQRAWLTDAEDKKIIIDHIVRIEDHEFQQHTSAAGLKSLFCGKSFDETGLKSYHADPAADVKGMSMFILSKTEAATSSASSKQKQEENLRNLPVIRKHLEPFYYYSEATCGIVARRFAVDFEEFGYSKAECFQYVRKNGRT